MQLVSTRFRKSIGRNFARWNSFSGLHTSHSISTCCSFLGLALGAFRGGVRNSGRTLYHFLQSMDDCQCGLDSAASAPFPLTANCCAPNNLLLRETPLSVSFCTMHTSCQETRCLISAVNACKQKENQFASALSVFKTVSTSDTLPHLDSL